MEELRVGDIVDRRYELRRAIARGGAGTVFEAIHRLTHRSVALKLLRARAASDAESQRRLLREAQALTLARHPNVVAALDAGVTDRGQPYLVMELLEGRSLAGILTARTRTGIADTVCLGRQLCDAVAVAHERGVVHRDIKPNNLFVAIDETGHETLKLFDFGIAALRGQALDPREPKLTEHGAVIGTPEYMAPEQLMGSETVDHRCDIYGIGVTLYECLTGTIPFEGTFGQILLQASTQPAPPLQSRLPDAPAELAAVVARALTRDPEDRYGDARELGDALVDAVGVLLGRTFLLGVRPTRPARHRPAATIPAPGAAGEAIEVAVADAVPSSRRRRRHARAPYTTPVTITLAGRGTLYGRSEDISEGGLLVMTAPQCEAGETAKLRFAVPGTGQFVETKSVVRWLRSGRGIGVVGFEFRGLDDSVRSSIRQYVAAKVGDEAANVPEPESAATAHR